MVEGLRPPAIREVPTDPDIARKAKEKLNTLPLENLKNSGIWRDRNS